MKLDISIGRPITRGGVTLWPAYNHQPPAPEYVTDPQAEAEGALAVDERADAEVPELVVTNRGATPVLLLEGETVLGNKQNRTLNVSVLVPPVSTTAVPVSCVEQGRWGARQAARRSPHHAPLNLRSLKTRSVVAEVRRSGARHADQGAVWAEVDRTATRYEVATPTMAMEDVYEEAAPSRKTGLDQLRPRAQQAGVVVGAGGRVRMLELFDKPATLAQYWEALLAGYAVEADDGADHRDPPPAMDAVFAFLHLIEQGRVSEATPPALGRELHFASSSAHGSALVWDGGLVHLSAFAES